MSDVEAEQTLKDKDASVSPDEMRLEHIRDKDYVITKRTNAQGSTAYIVGTAHYSEKSNEDVRNTIRKIKPDFVLLELCESRKGILTMTDEELLQKSRHLSVKGVREVIRENGFTQGLFQIAFYAMAAHIAKKLDVVPGGEFRAAFDEASKLPHCKINLIDRPIQITFKRALNALTFYQKLKFFFNFLFDNMSISQETVEQCKQKDFLDSVVEEISSSHPELAKVLIDERDMILCSAIKQAMHPVPVENNKMGFIQPVVCCVVGIGHVQGILKYWDTDIDVASLMKVPERENKKNWNRLKLISCIVICSFVAFKVFKRK